MALGFIRTATSLFKPLSHRYKNTMALTTRLGGERYACTARVPPTLRYRAIQNWPQVSFSPFGQIPWNFASSITTRLASARRGSAGGKSDLTSLFQRPVCIPFARSFSSISNICAPSYPACAMSSRPSWNVSRHGSTIADAAFLSSTSRSSHRMRMASGSDSGRSVRLARSMASVWAKAMASFPVSIAMSRYLDAVSVASRIFFVSASMLGASARLGSRVPHPVSAPVDASGEMDARKEPGFAELLDDGEARAGSLLARFDFVVRAFLLVQQRYTDELSRVDVLSVAHLLRHRGLRQRCQPCEEVHEPAVFCPCRGRSLCDSDECRGDVFCELEAVVRDQPREVEHTPVRVRVQAAGAWLSTQED